MPLQSSRQFAKRRGTPLRVHPSGSPVPGARETRLWHLPGARANALRATLTLTGLDSPVACSGKPSCIALVHCNALPPVLRSIEKGDTGTSSEQRLIA